MKLWQRKTYFWPSIEYWLFTPLSLFFFFSLDQSGHLLQSKRSSYLQSEAPTFLPIYLSITPVVGVLTPSRIANPMPYPNSSHPGYASADSSLILPRSSSFGVLRRDSWVQLFPLSS